MPNNTKISDMSPAEELNTTDLLMISQQDAEVETEFHTKNTTIGDLADEVVTGIQFTNDLDTNDKTIVGAINEAAAVGKKSDGYTDDSFTSENYPDSWSGSPCWIDSGETVDEHIVYKSDAGTYGKQAGDSLCTFLVKGYDDVTIYVKQDNIDTNRSYMLLGYANTPVRKQYCAECYQDETLTNYVYHQYNYLNGKPTTIEALYHVDAPTVPGSVSIDLQDGQWIDSGETVNGNIVYKSHGGSYHVPNGSSKCIIEIKGVSSFSIFCKPSSESGYDKTYIGKLDTIISKDDSSTYINSFSGVGNYTEVKYEINDENRHTIEILYAKDSGGDNGDDCGYIYFIKNGTPSESRGYIYLVPGTPHTPLGEVFNDYTNNKALGNYSHVEGSNNFAYGESSHAEGYFTQAIGPKSHAEGYQTTTSYDYAHAEGFRTTASSHAAHAEGNSTLASGSNSHAEGDNTQATTNYAHAEGEYSIASGSASHAEGVSTTASEYSSHAEGYQTTASASQAHAEGYKTIAGGEHSHAEGYNTVASGHDSHAEGHHSQALGNYCHAEGYENIANYQGAHAEGSRNVASKLNSHAEGESTKAVGVGAHSEGGYTTASGKYSHAEGSNLNYVTEGPVASGVAAHAEGILTKAEGMGSHAEGMPAIKYQKYNSAATYNTDDIVYYFPSHDNTDTVLYFARAKVDNIQGISPEDSGSYQYWESYRPSTLSSYFYSANGYYSSTAIGNGAHAEGILAIAWGEGSHAEGIYDTENGSHVFAASPGSHAEGQGSQAYAPGAHAEGINTRVFATGGHAEGINTQATSPGAHAEGIGTSAVTTYQHVQGTYNTTDANQAFIIGNGYENEGVITRSNAMTVGWNGNMVLAGDITVGTSLNTTATTIGGAINEIVARIPAPPTTDGTYTLSVTISNGVPTYSWV